MGYLDYYCIIGVDQVNVTSDPSLEQFAVAMKVYNMKNQQVMTYVDKRITLESIVGDESLFVGLTNRLQTMFGIKCYRFCIYPGNSIKQKVISRLIMTKYPSFIPRQHAAEYHGKTIIFEAGSGRSKQILQVLPSSYMGFDLNGDRAHDIKEWDQFCNLMVRSSGSVSDFCKHPQTAFKKIKGVFNFVEPSPISSDSVQYHSSTIKNEIDNHMNRGGRQFARNMYEKMKVDCFDINSAYGFIAMTGHFSSTDIRPLKILPDVDYSDLSVWDFIDKTMTKYHNHWHMRVLLTVEKAVIKDPNNGIRISESAVNHLADKNTRIKNIGTGFTQAMENCTFMLFIQELKDFLRLYKVYGVKIRKILCTHAKKLSNASIKKNYELFVDAMKSKGTPEYAEKKVLRNIAAYGFNAMMPGVEGTDEKNIWARYKSGREDGMYNNVLAGAEITMLGRENLKNIERVANDMGCTAVYGNTDSIYLLSETEQQHNNNMRFMKLINQRINSYVRHSSGVKEWCEVPIEKDIGSLKYEGRCDIIHGGVNRLFKSHDGLIDEASLSGLTWQDLFRNGESRRIDDMKRGRVIKNMPYVVDKGLYTDVNYVDWVF